MEANDTMLDDLPDSMLCHILTFLPSKDAAATSVLAKRWRYLLTSTSIYLDFAGESEPDSDYGVFRRPRSVHPSLFGSKTVVDLTLRKCLIDFPEGQKSDLVSLKSLVLERVDFRDAGAFRRLLSGCPGIEELRVDTEATYFQWEIRSKTLQSLYLELDLRFLVTRDDDFDLTIDTPVLSCLELHLRRKSLKRFEFLYPAYWEISAPSLVEADISFDFPAHSDRGAVVIQGPLLQFLQKLSSIKELRLWCDHVKIGSPLHPAASRKFLELEQVDIYGRLPILFSILENADNVKLLIVRQSMELRMYGWSRPLQVPECIASHLEYVVFESFMCSESELELLNYLLVNGKVLKKVCIYCYSSYWRGIENRYQELEGMSSKIELHVHIRRWSHRCNACHVFFPGECKCSLEVALLPVPAQV